MPRRGASAHGGVGALTASCSAGSTSTPPSRLAGPPLAALPRDLAKAAGSLTGAGGGEAARYWAGGIRTPGVRPPPRSTSSSTWRRRDASGVLVRRSSRRCERAQCRDERGRRRPGPARPRGGDRQGLQHGDVLRRLPRPGDAPVGAAPAQRAAQHDELLFIVQHQVAELWLKLLLHELHSARGLLAADELGPALKRLARVKHVQKQARRAVGRAGDPDPQRVRPHPAVPRDEAPASRATQYRSVEFLLGNKNADMVRVFEHDEAIASRSDGCCASRRCTTSSCATSPDAGMPCRMPS